MRDFIIRRLLILIPVMVGVSLLTFALFNVIPGDACVLRLGFGSTPETLEDCREQHGLNRALFPITVNSDLPLVHVQESQYGGWLWDIVAHQDLGQSLAEGGAKVSTELEHRLPITLQLMVMTIIFALVLGVIPGMLSAIRPNIVLFGDTDDHLRPLMVRLDAAAVWPWLRAVHG
jgi:peptide/nickel transport system permease protein